MAVAAAAHGATQVATTATSATAQMQEKVAQVTTMEVDRVD